MIIDFEKLKEITIEKLNGGNGQISSKMHIDNLGKIMLSRIPKGASIGSHEQKTGHDINYVISGHGKAICNGTEEILKVGMCHYCPKGSTHSIINDGDEDLILFNMVI